VKKRHLSQQLDRPPLHKLHIISATQRNSHYPGAFNSFPQHTRGRVKKSASCQTKTPSPQARVGGCSKTLHSETTVERGQRLKAKEQASAAAFGTQPPARHGCSALTESSSEAFVSSSNVRDNSYSPSRRSLVSDMFRSSEELLACATHLNTQGWCTGRQNPDPMPPP